MWVQLCKERGNGSSVKVVYLKLWDRGGESLPAHQMFPRVSRNFQGKPCWCCSSTFLLSFTLCSQPSPLCQYISFQPSTHSFVEFRLRSKANCKFASLWYAFRMKLLITMNFIVSITSQIHVIGCPMTMSCFYKNNFCVTVDYWFLGFTNRR